VIVDQFLGPRFPPLKVAPRGSSSFCLLVSLPFLYLFPDRLQGLSSPRSARSSPISDLSIPILLAGFFIVDRTLRRSDLF